MRSYILNFARKVVYAIRNKFRKKIKIKLDLRELFMQEMVDDNFNRLDIVVRYLAIENYYGLNNYGFDLYKKMQAARINNDWVDESLDKFKKLISSYQNNGYDNTSTIILNKEAKLWDGSHRIALGLYHNLYDINCLMTQSSIQVDYSENWFIINDFDDSELCLIKLKLNEIVGNVNINFVCTLWPPAQNCFEEITETFNKLYDVSEVVDYEFDDFTFNNIVKGIYYVDDIEKWKIDEKIKAMGSKELKKVRVINFKVNCPRYRLKVKTNSHLSVDAEIIKKLYRDRFRGAINNYRHDIIMHVGDNISHNTHIHSLLNFKLNISPFFDSVKHLEYVLLKTDTPYMPSDFPNNVPFSRDIDIFCTRKNFIDFIEKTILFLSNLNHVYTINRLDLYSNDNEFERSKIRVELNGFLCFLFDISIRIENIQLNYSLKILKSRRSEKNYYIPSLKDELIIRLTEYSNNKSKKYHALFFCENFNKLNSNDSEYLISKLTKKNKILMKNILDTYK